MAHIEHKLFTGQVVTGDAQHIGYLASYFQNWAEDTLGMSAEESLALFVFGTNLDHGMNARWLDDLPILANKAASMIRDIEVPYLCQPKRPTD